MHLIDLQDLCHLAGGIFVVAGQQDRGDARLFERADGLGGALTQLVGQGEQPGKAAVNRGEDEGAALAAQLLGPPESLRWDDGAVFFQQLPIARQHRKPLCQRLHAAPGNHPELLRVGDGLICRERGTPLAAAADNRLAQRVLGAQFRRSGEEVELFIGEALLKALYRTDLRSAVGQGSGFVKADALDPGQAFQRVTLPHQKAVFGRVADGRHDGGGGGQHQRAGAKDDQDGDRADDLPADQPGQCGGGQGDDDNPGGPAVGDADDFGLAGVR